MTSQTASPDTNTAIDIDGRVLMLERVIRSAGDIAEIGFARRETRAFSMKGHQDFLTETDALVEAHIRSEFARDFPQDGFIGEEGGETVERREAEAVWVVDPIDGTANFARGIPHYCVSIALVAVGRIELGAIYHPSPDELYLARRGKGATLNGRAIKAAATRSPAQACLELGWSPRVSNAAYLAILSAVLEGGANVRRGASGALGLAYVAAGRSDGYFEAHMNAWDCLAGLLLVREAGGIVNDFLGEDSLRSGGRVFASAPALAASFGAAVGIGLPARDAN